jgi:CubicO group peptidase (beta-lactamase class C family)
VRLHADQEARAALLASPPIEHYLEALRAQAGIPGLSAAVVQDGELVWERGFGFENVESRIRARPDTPYYVGGLSQTVAAVLLLQCVEHRRLDLDQPVREYGLSLPEQGATLRHVLSHTSAGTPGAAYRFDPDRYAQLSTVMEWCAPQQYRKSVAHRVLERLTMRDSVPGADLQNPGAGDGLFDAASLDRYRQVMGRIAVPYRTDGRGRATRVDLPVPEGINGSNGLVTTVRDLAEFERALDTSVLLLEETRAAAWSPAIGSDGTPLPTGLGWFVQRYKDETVVWQYGHVASGYSSMVIRLPARRVSLILLANSDGLAAPFELDAGDVTHSLFAALFLRLFVV